MAEYLQFAVAFIALLGGFFAYILGLRIKHDILENNERIEREIATVKDAQVVAVNGLRSELMKEFGNTAIRLDDRYEKIEKELNDLNAALADKILHSVNGKYVRTDLFQQQVASIQERFASLKELIEANMEKIEEGLDRQIVDLKDRILHSK